MNTYFQFKQFIIQQDKTAMKVCTDACLLGAWVANKIENKDIVPQNILDIGCGTGLLSLMLAQKTNAIIDAVEIDENAFVQATENTAISKWENQINVFNEDIVRYTSAKKYDLIICNPPFFNNQLKSNNDDRNIAMHATQLSFVALAKAVKNNLSENGKAALLLPYNIVNEFAAIMENEQLYLNEELNISHSTVHPFFRSVLLFTCIKEKQTQNTISIRDKGDKYSAEFKMLLKDYYLYL